MRDREAMSMTCVDDHEQLQAMRVRCVDERLNDERDMCSSSSSLLSSRLVIGAFNPNLNPNPNPNPNHNHNPNPFHDRKYRLGSE